MQAGGAKDTEVLRRERLINVSYAATCIEALRILYPPGGSSHCIVLEHKRRSITILLKTIFSQGTVSGADSPDQ